MGKSGEKAPCFKAVVEVRIDDGGRTRQQRQKRWLKHPTLSYATPVLTHLYPLAAHLESIDWGGADLYWK